MTRRRIVLALLAVVLVACVAVSAWGQLWLHGQHQDDSRRAAALAAAKTGTAEILSYDYRRLAAGAKSTSALLTGNALSQYHDVQAPLLKAAPGLKAVVSAQVKVATVLSSSSDTARVLLFVDQTSTSTKLTAPQLDQSRVVVGLVRRHGNWLISSISAV
jgi:Mce-associated membrane protein